MSNQNNFDLNEIINKLKGTENKDATEQEVDNFLNENLSSAQAQTIKDIIGDKEKTRQILESQQAKELFKKFFGGNNNG